MFRTQKSHQYIYSTKSHAVAGCFSRPPVSGNGAVGNPSDVTLFNLSQISLLPVNEMDMMARIPC